MKQLETLQGKNNVYYIGAYVVPGIPLLENGVVSAMDVARKLGVETPWKIQEKYAQQQSSNWFLIMLVIVFVLYFII